MLDKAQFTGKWPSILSALGVDKRFLTNKHGPCPMCEGKDRFRFDDKDGAGTWYCSKCGAGNGFSLVMAMLRMDFKEALAKVSSVAGTASVGPAKQSPTEAMNRAAMKSLWRQSSPIQPNDAAGRYLTRRIGHVPFCPALRSVARLAYDGDFRPAMIAKVVAPDCLSSTIHRTFLTNDGQKAPGSSPRRLMRGKMAAGSAIRLEAATGLLGVAEGLETALSASALFGVPTWALINAGNMEAFPLPNGVDELWIFGDNDTNFRGQAAAFRLANRLAKPGLSIRVEIPPMPGFDWNDVLTSQRKIQKVATA